MTSTDTRARKDDPGKPFELALIGAIKFPEDIKLLRKAGLSEADFKNPSYKTCFNYLVEASLNQTHFPTFADKEQMWALEGLVEDHRDVYGLATELKKIRTTDTIKNSVIEAAQILEHDPFTAASNLQRALNKLSFTDTSRARLLESEATSRLDELLKRAEARANNEFVGMKMGLACLDESNIGIQNGEVVTIQGRSGIGKSWYLINFCAQAYIDGKRILYLSPEMSAMETELRADVFLMRHFNIPTSHKGLVTADDEYIKYYKEYVNILSKNRDGRWVTIDSDKAGSFSIAAIHDLVDQHHPDIVAIDGFHLLAGHKNGQSWEGVKANADAFKALCLNKQLVGIDVTQARRTVGMYDNPNNDEIAYGHALVEASDLMISLTGVRGAPDRRKLKITKRRNGELPMFRISLKYDVDKGWIEELINEQENFDEDLLSEDDI